MNIGADAETNLQRADPCEHRGAGIPGAVGCVPNDLIAVKHRTYLFSTRFDLLQANDICLRIVKKIVESSPEGGAESIDIPRDEFHTTKENSERTA